MSSRKSLQQSIAEAVRHDPDSISFSSYSAITEKMRRRKPSGSPGPGYATSGKCRHDWQ